MAGGDSDGLLPLIMSVKEAKNIMPDSTKYMSDEEIVNFINNLELLAGAIIKMVQDKDIIQSKHSI